MNREKIRTGGDKLRALNVPERIEVELEYGRPKKVGRVPRGATSGSAVESIIECWRIDDEWWRQPISRRCYEVVLESGRRVVVFEDLLTGEWWVQKP
jgi:hypothetical protein